VKVKSVRLSHVLGVILGLMALTVFLILGMSGAAGQSTVTVIPKVLIESGGSLSIVSGTSGPENNLIDLGEVGPGLTAQKTLTLGVTANDSWRLTVSKSQDFKCNDPTAPGYGQFIPSSSFTYTSNGPSGPTYATTDTQFGSPSNVVTGGTSASGFNVNVVYKLVVPASQPAGYYTAPSHTYTLVVGSP
jgi:hypothetical protein